MKRLQHPKVTTASQIRASVVAQWTRIHDVRVVQYMSGHKYVSTTERYQATHLEDLKEQMRIYHPLK
jgi:integrase/recombinase XerD